MTLALRKTVIKGETAHGDYLVLEDGKAIGRIRLGPVENQDSTCGLVVIQALDGPIRFD
jgi:hypothetical protein